jgi:leucyl aminopeptidase
MNLIYNVGKGAASEPRAVFIHYQGDESRPDEVDFGIVGKGVTYDTGGLNIKTAMMELMYHDKGGACAVLGALKGCLSLGLKKNVIFACGFADNAIGPDAYKPNDVIQAMNGLFVEIGNTDAEGRLVMADTMTYMQRHFKPKRVAYIATLTGACMVALGLETAGLFSTDKDMIHQLQDASEKSHEPIWHLPITQEHRDSMKGRLGADLNNLGKNRFGGASQAAAFLECFIEDKRPWAHVDIAGPFTMSVDDMGGFGAPLFLQFLKDHA